MELFIAGRQEGKTARALHRFMDDANGVLVVPNFQQRDDMRRRIVDEYSMQMYEMVKLRIITFRQCRDRAGGAVRTPRYVIDNIDWWVFELTGGLRPDLVTFNKPEEVVVRGEHD